MTAPRRTKVDVSAIVRQDANPYEAVSDLRAAIDRAMNDHKAALLTMSSDPTKGTDPRHAVEHARRVADLTHAWADAVANALRPEVWQ
jgi:hypothetical protein